MYIFSCSGVCPVAYFSRTLLSRIGEVASTFFMTNCVVSALQAAYLNIIDEVCNGIHMTKHRALAVATAAGCIESSVSFCFPVEQAHIAREAVCHAECRQLHGGEGKKASVNHFVGSRLLITTTQLADAATSTPRRTMFAALKPIDGIGALAVRTATAEAVDACGERIIWIVDNNTLVNDYSSDN